MKSRRPAANASGQARPPNQPEMNARSTRALARALLGIPSLKDAPRRSGTRRRQHLNPEMSLPSQPLRIPRVSLAVHTLSLNPMQFSVSTSDVSAASNQWFHQHPESREWRKRQARGPQLNQATFNLASSSQAPASASFPSASLRLVGFHRKVQPVGIHLVTATWASRG